MQRVVLIGFVGLLCSFFASCTSDQPDNEPVSCVPGESQSCYCTDGSPGAQVCDDDGRFSPCECDGTGSTSDTGIGDVSDTSDVPCEPDCTDLECGDDPVCGESCGDCSTPETCSYSGQCVCEPDCTDLECGDDPICGESCGDCTEPETCNGSGQCTCEPDCTDLECGDDPVCGESCGECTGINVCDAGECHEADVHSTWTLDGDVVHTTRTWTAEYTVSNDYASLRMPGGYVAQNTSINVQDVEETSGTVMDCEAEATAGMSLLTMGMDDLPLEWKNMNFTSSQCDNSLDDDEDELDEWELELTEISEDHLSGSFTVRIIGAGPRDGSVMEVEGEFDTEMDPI